MRIAPISVLLIILLTSNLSLSEDLSLPNEIRSIKKAKRSAGDNVCLQEVKRSEEYEDIEKRSIKTLVVERCAGEDGSTTPCRRIKRSEIDVPVLKTREVVEMVANCCAGWSKDSNGKCLVPVCDGGCVNDGECKSPGECLCKEGFEGARCQRKKRAPVLYVDREMEELIKKRVERSLERSKRATSGVVGNPVEVGSPCTNGETASSGCTSCSCQNGAWACANIDCDGACSVLGDGHFITFDNKAFQAKGTCD